MQKLTQILGRDGFEFIVPAATGNGEARRFKEPRDDEDVSHGGHHPDALPDERSMAGPHTPEQFVHDSAAPPLALKLRRGLAWLLRDVVEHSDEPFALMAT